ncbi:hypothetical protein M0802_013091 [Mischocyttarus mexicanus]|nr:hypothetical protein M0802_013091 [Mischocyttarus mexicanus]
MGLTPAPSNSRIERKSRYLATGSNNFRSEHRTARETSVNKTCYNYGLDRHFIRNCIKSQPLNRDFQMRDQLSRSQDQIKYTVPQPTNNKMYLQPCTSDWETISMESFSQIPAQQ